MSENNQTTITSVDHPNDQDQQQPTMIEDQKNRIVNKEIPINNS